MVVDRAAELSQSYTANLGQWTHLRLRRPRHLLKKLPNYPLDVCTECLPVVVLVYMPDLPLGRYLYPV